MRFIKWTFISIALLIIGFGAFLAYATFCDYQPQRCEEIFHTEKNDTVNVENPFSILSWNIGYAGLDRDMDFFYDGGTKVRPEREQLEENILNIRRFIEQNDSLNFILLQEVDKSAKRSYYQDQVELFDHALSNHHSFFALNYNVKYVPLPIYAPMGFVESGIQTLTKHQPQIVERHAFPYNFSWPLSIFMLDRCFLATYYPLSNGKQLIIINTHNSAFDDNGEIRKAELNLFRDFMVNEYQKGNYVITGGDFNQCPPNLTTNFQEEPFDYEDYIAISDTLFPQNWKFTFDNSTPSNRRVIDAYKRGETKVTLIDFFITSPNVKVKNIKCIDLGFNHSDHNPIIGTFSLKQDHQ